MISIAGVNTVIDDEDNELHRWMSRFRSVEDLQIFCDVPAAFKSLGLASRSCSGGGPGIPRNNYPRDIPPRINTLYWPSGAARWAYGLFLATETQVGQIGNPGQKNLVIHDGAFFLNAPMWMLNPRPISAFNQGFADSNLWLVPLVDDRYWWQFRVAELKVKYSTTWDAIYSAIEAAIGTPITRSGIDGGFANPDPVELNRKLSNAAVFLDAVASSVGHRIVRSLDGVVQSQSSSDASALRNANRAFPYRIIAGGEICNCVSAPRSVITAFRRSKCGTLSCPRDDFFIEIPTTLAVQSPASTKKLVRTTMYADMTNESDPSVPTNFPTMFALAVSNANATYGWLTEEYDITFAGVQLWFINGFDSYIEFSAARSIGSGDRIFQTRVASMPLNFGVEQQLSQDPALKVSDCCGEIIRFQLRDKLPLGGKSIAKEIKSGPGYQRIGDEFTIKDPWDEPGSWREDLIDHNDDGYRGFAVIPPCPEYDGGDNPIREIVWMETIARSINFKLLSDMTGGQAVAELVSYYFGKDPKKVFGEQIPVYDTLQLFPMAIEGCLGMARYNERDHRYEVHTCDQQCLIMRAELAAELCPSDSAYGSSASITGASLITWPPYGKVPKPLPTSAENVHNMAGMAGDTVTIVFNFFSRKWEILEVRHHLETLATRLQAQPLICSLDLTKKQFAVQKCSDAITADQVFFTTVQVVTGATKTSCGIIFTRSIVCVLGGALGGSSIPITFETVDVLTKIKSVNISMGDPTQGCQIDGEVKRICVIGSESAADLPGLVTFTQTELVRDVLIKDVSGEDCLVQKKVFIWHPCAEGEEDESSIACFTDCPEPPPP